MRDRFTLHTENALGVSLRAICESDCERLRLWKNANRQSFFFQEEITPEGQQAWFAGYLEREHDFMFLVEVDGDPVGCIGFRLIDDQGDIYNVILGVPEIGGRGVMSVAIQTLCSYARTWTERIGLKVLRTNPAVRWYEKNGFVVTTDHETYFDMTLDWERCRSVPVTKHEG